MESFYVMDVQDALQLELRKAQNREEIAKRKLARLHDRLQRLDDAVQNSRDEREAYEELKTRLKQYESRNRELTGEVSVWRERFLDASMELDTINGELHSSQEHVAVQRAQQEHLEARLAKRAERQAKIEATYQALKSRMEFLEQERHRNLDQMRHLDSNLDSTREALQSARTQLMASRQQMLRLDERLDELEEEKAVLEATVESLRAEAAKVQDLREALSRTTAELFEARQALLRHHIADGLSGQDSTRGRGGVGLLRRAQRTVGSWLKLN